MVSAADSVHVSAHSNERTQALLLYLVSVSGLVVHCYLLSQASATCPSRVQPQTVSGTRSTSAVIAQRLHDWLQDESQSLAASQQSPLPSVAYLQSTIRNPHAAHLYQFIVELHPQQPHKQRTSTSTSHSTTACSASSLATVRDQLTANLASTQRSIEHAQSELHQLQGAIQQQHRQVKQRQMEEQEQRKRILLIQAALGKLTHKLTRSQQWHDTVQRALKRSTTEPLSALVELSTQALQQFCHAIEQAKAEKTEVEQARSIRPLLTALRHLHIQLAVKRQRLIKEAAQYDAKTAELLPCSTSSASQSTLPLLQRDIAAHRALLQYTERLQAGENREDVNEVKETWKKSTEEITKLRAQVSQRWTEVAALQYQRRKMRQARQPYIAELQSDQRYHTQPLLTLLSTALMEQRTLMEAEWEQLRELPLSVAHRVAVQTAAGTTSTFLLPASSSSLQAMTAPWPMLRPVLDATPAPWYQSADRLLPSLVAHHMRLSATHSAARHHSQLLLSTLHNDCTLPTFPTLLASSAAVDVTHSATTVSLDALHASLSSRSQSAAHLSRLLQSQLQYGSLQLLSSLRVDGRDGREWMERLSGLEAKCERHQQRALDRKEAQLLEAQKRFGRWDNATVVQKLHRYGEDNYSKIG